MASKLSRTLAALAFAVIAIGCASARSEAMRVTGSISGPDGGWDYASIDRSTQMLFVARHKGITAVDLRSRHVFPLFVRANHVHGVLILPGGLMVSSDEGTSTVELLSAADGREMASLPAGRKPDAIAYDAETGLVAVMNSLDGTAELIDPQKRVEVGSITIGGVLEFAEGDGAGRIFVNVKSRSEVAVLDLLHRRVSARYRLPGCADPSGLAVDARLGLVLSACANGKAIALSIEDGRPVSVAPIGRGPDAVILDRQRRRFLIPCGDSGVLTIISEEANGTLRRQATVRTAEGARTGALDPSTGNLYLPTANFEPRKPGQWQGDIIPGSFRILILSVERPTS